MSFLFHLILQGNSFLFNFTSSSISKTDSETKEKLLGFFFFKFKLHENIKPVLFYTG